MQVSWQRERDSVPEILKNSDGSTNWAAIFAGFGAMVVLILQQWQTYKIAELREEASVQKIMFLDKDTVYKIEKELQKRMQHLEDEYIPRNDLNNRLERMEKDIDRLKGLHDENK